MTIGVATGARFAIHMQLVDGELCCKQCKLKQHFIGDAITAIHLLKQGKAIWVKQDAKLVTYVERVLGGRAA